MTTEENIAQKLNNRFNFLENKIKIQRARRLYLTIDIADFNKIFEYAIKELKFSHLISITGLDEQEKLSFVYHLSQDSGIVLNLKVSVDKNNPVINTVTKYFPGADIYERELIDLFGAKVEGLPPANRYPLSDDWPIGEFPLRKDWKKRGE
ncbi:MAG: NADH-quinone oxidoreductase subunit C [Candidatus Omnitrophota bacterium]